MSIEVTPAAEPANSTRIVAIEMYESHNGERCECIDPSLAHVYLHEGDTLDLSEFCYTLDPETGETVQRQFTLHIKVERIS